MSKISYENIKRTEAVLNGRKYNFRSQAEFRYACYLCHLQEQGQSGISSTKTYCKY